MITPEQNSDTNAKKSIIDEVLNDHKRDLLTLFGMCHTHEHGHNVFKCATVCADLPNCPNKVVPKGWYEARLKQIKILQERIKNTDAQHPKSEPSSVGEKPEWYSKCEIFDWLKRNDYSDTIANELSGKIAGLRQEARKRIQELEKYNKYQADKWKELESKIKELEADKDRLLSALKGIADSCDPDNPTHENIWRISDHCLNDIKPQK